MDANEDVGVCVEEGDGHSEELRREVYSTTRVVISGAREVRSTTGGTVEKMFSAERHVESEARDSNRDVYAVILEERSGNLDVISGRLWSDTRETRLGSRRSVRSWLAEMRPGRGSFSGKENDEDCEP